MTAVTPSPRSCVLTVNVGSSSMKFSLFEVGSPPMRLVKGVIDGIGHATGRLVVDGAPGFSAISQVVAMPDHASAVRTFMAWFAEHVPREALAAVGHRVVHGGPKYWEPQRLTAEVIDELRRLTAFDPEHLPVELLLIDEIARHLADVTQFACFDTAFHHELPRVARLLPIPRRYEAKGVRRYGFHGLSYAYLMEALARLDGSGARGRVVLAHLGSGASMAAVRDGHPVDTTMALTPAAGLVMSTRAGDVDPGLASYFARSEGLSASAFDRMMNHESGLIGISETSSDMRTLLDAEASDVRAKEAVALFCYQAKKCLGAYAAALGGLDTLVFAGGIGENSPAVRARICAGLDFLGIELDESRNAKSTGLISADASRISVRVIRTDEEVMIARSVFRALGVGASDAGGGA
jgi:acetate kinase